MANQIVTQFWDVANFEAAYRPFGVEPDFLGLRDEFARGRSVADSYIYVPISPYMETARRPLIRLLEQNGFFVRSKVGRKRPDGGWKCDFDVEIARDVLQVVWRGRGCDAIVVGCGDGDLIPVYKDAREAGVRVEVVATRANLAADVRRVASEVIDLEPIILQEIEAARIHETNGAPGAGQFQ